MPILISRAPITLSVLLGTFAILILFSTTHGHPPVILTPNPDTLPEPPCIPWPRSATKAGIAWGRRSSRRSGDPRQRPQKKKSGNNIKKRTRERERDRERARRHRERQREREKQKKTVAFAPPPECPTNIGGLSGRGVLTSSLDPVEEEKRGCL